MEASERTPDIAEPAESDIDNRSGDSDTSISADKEQLERDILEALKVVRDPEIPVNVVDLGLIYHLEINDEGEVAIQMTLTSPGCPVQDMIQADAELAAMKVEGVRRAAVEFVWSPPWTPQKMTEDGKKQMRMFGFNI